MTEAKKTIEELKSDRLVAAAAAKLDFEIQLEARDDELMRCRGLIQQSHDENYDLKLALNQATKSGILTTLCLSIYRVASLP